MPDRVFRSLHDPPLITDRFLAHGAYSVFSLWSLVSGIALMVSGLVGVAVSPSIAGFPIWLTLALGVAIGVGGLSSALGLLRPLKRIDMSWKLEQSGWWISGAGWASYSLLVLLTFPASILAWGSAGAISLSAAFRIVVLHLIEIDARAQKKKVDGERLTSDDDLNDEFEGW